MSGTIIIKTNLNHLYYTINIPDAQPTESEEDVHFKPLEHGSAVVHVNNGCYNVILADCDDVYGLDQWSEETCVDEGDTAVVTKFFSDSHGNAIHPIRTLNGTITIRTNLEGLYYTITDMHAPEGSANRYLKDQEYMQSTEVTITVPVGFYQVTLVDRDRYYGGLRWGEQHVVNENAVVVVEKNYFDRDGEPLVPSKPIAPPPDVPPVSEPEPKPPMLNGTITIRTNLEGLYYTITDMHAPEGSANRYLKDQEYMQSTEVTITVPVGFYQVTLIDLDRYYGGLRWGEQHVVNGNAVVVVEKNYYDHVGGPLVPSKPIVPPYGDPPVPKPEPEPEPEPDLEWRPKPSMLMRLLTFVIEVFKKLVKKST